MAIGLSEWLFDPSGLTPHGFCLLWQPGLIWTYAASDVGIAVAYFSIPVALAVFARRRRDLMYRRVLWLFAAFILLCGATHWLDVLTLWVPAYGLQALVKAATAIVSLATAVALWRLMPQALAIPTPAQLRAADDALRESETRSRLSFEQSPVPLHTLDGDFVLTAVSDSWLALLGYARQEVIGRSIMDFYAPGSVAAGECIPPELEERGEIQDVERRLVRRDGTVVETLIAARLERRGGAMLLVCGVTDVTARRRAEEALRASETRFRQSFELSPVPLYTLDGADLITGVSNSWLALFGYTRAEVIGRSMRTLFAPGFGSNVEDDRTRLMADGELHDVERRYVRKDGSIIEALISARLERHETPVVVVCGVTDVTARRRAEEALRASEERLRQAQKMEAVGQLTGGIAHDFNNMLQAIAGGLELIERRVAQGRSQEIGRYFASTRQALDNAASLTRRLMAFARRESLQPRAVDPDSLVRGIEELLRRTLGPAIRLEMWLRDGKWRATCDPNQLESALLNLAINARDAMPDGGTLSIATADRHMLDSDLLDQDDAAAGDYVEISVADTGVGMTPEIMSHVFEPFFTTKPIGAGTGLGLSQLYGFVRQSQGFVRIESAPGEGTIVRLYLPRHVAETAQAEPLREAAPFARTSVAGSANGASVLVVEDEEGVRALVVDTLRELGCVVREAGDGHMAMRLLQSAERFDMMVSDVGLPGPNGRQLADAARAGRPDMPVLLMTGYAGTALDRMRVGEDLQVIRKPFALDTLATTVAAMLARSTLVR